MSHLETTERKPMPDLAEWEPNYNEIFYLFDGEVVIANYNQHVGLTEEKCTLPIFYIKKNHYKNNCNNNLLKIWCSENGVNTPFSFSALPFSISTMNFSSSLLSF